MTSVEVRIEIVVQDPAKLSEFLEHLSEQGLLRGPLTTIQSSIAEAVATLVPRSSGLEVAFTTGKLMS